MGFIDRQGRIMALAIESKGRAIDVQNEGVDDSCL